MHASLWARNAICNLAGKPALCLSWDYSSELTALRLLCRYFAESAATLACMVFGVRNCVGSDGGSTRDYWITDGTPLTCGLSLVFPSQNAPYGNVKWKGKHLRLLSP